MNETEEESASAEISSIVRQSITTKLHELNADIDDEVPDYILLMIGNKRTRSQIRSELGLFMSDDDTEHFCVWLFKILDKLHEKRRKIEGFVFCLDRKIIRIIVSRYTDVDALEEKPKTAAYWRGKYDEAMAIVEGQKNDIGRLKHEILELKLAKEKSYQRKRSAAASTVTDNLLKF